MNRRELIAGLGSLAIGAAMSPPAAGGGWPVYGIQRQLSMEMALAYQLPDRERQKALFKSLFDVQSTFQTVNAWPSTALVVSDAMSALRRVLAGESIDRAGYKKVERRSVGPFVVFSDHHIVPPTNRQKKVWLQNRAAYAKLIRHYAENGYTIVENGDVEDLVILEPRSTEAIYKKVLGQDSKKKIDAARLLTWFRERPNEMRDVLTATRSEWRQVQLDQIFDDPGNKPYYEALAEAAAASRLVRVAGNHDYELQQLQVREPWMVPVDILLIGDDNDYAVMHGHQFDQATNPAVAPLYGEVISECLGVWFQGPDRSWSAESVRTILQGGFPNRLATHGEHASGAASLLMTALLTQRDANDEEWAMAWESLFGHPIAWEYGANDWQASVRGGFSRPRDLIDDAMQGQQFFKFRHLDEMEIVQNLATWDIETALVLGHSHEVRAVEGGPGHVRYYNSGAAGRFERLIWALEITGRRDVAVVAWAIDTDGSCRRFRFDRKDAALFSYFDSVPTSEVVA
jgi:predicted phosphodiesterase